MRPMDKGLFLIEGKQVYLRPITVEDTDMVLSWRNSKRVVENFIYRKPISRQEHLSWLENKVFKGAVHQFVVCTRDGDTACGSVYLQNFDEERKEAESGIFMGNTALLGKGLGTEAYRLLARYGFDDLGLEAICARVLAGNTASRRLHEKLGYRQEAYLRDELLIEGRYEDLIRYIVVKGDLRNE